MLIYNDLISQVLSVVPLGQCLSNLFFKSKETLAICEIIANNGFIMIQSISDTPLVLLVLFTTPAAYQNS